MHCNVCCNKILCSIASYLTYLISEEDSHGFWLGLDYGPNQLDNLQTLALDKIG